MRNRAIYRLKWTVAAAVLLACALAISCASAATEGDYDYAVTDGKAAITKYNGTETAVTTPATLGGYPVTGISGSAFLCNEILQSVIISDGVTAIGSNAFEYCTSLVSVFIPEGVTSIGYSAFNDCSSLAGITLPESVTSIGSYAFPSSTRISCAIGSDMAMLVLRSYHDFEAEDALWRYLFNQADKLIGLTFVRYMGTATDYTIPAGVTSIGSGAFSNCTTLMSVVIPESVRSIGSSAFPSSARIACAIGSDLAKLVSKSWHDFTDGDFVLRYTYNDNIITGLTLCRYTGVSSSITIPDGVTYIGYQAFQDRAFLANVTLPEGLIRIGEYAFSGCASLSSVVIPDGVTTIDFDAFNGCTSLLNVEIPDSVVSMDSQVFYECTSLLGIDLPNGLTEIKSTMFAECKSLKTIMIPDSVESIGYGAFNNCSSLVNVSLPDGLREIGEYAFDGCDSLESIALPPGLTRIGEYAFDRYTRLPCEIGSDISRLLSKANNNFYAGGFYLCYTYNGRGVETGLELRGYDGGAASVKVPDGVTSMPNTMNRFAAWSGTVRSITLPEGLARIGEGGLSINDSFGRYIEYDTLVLPSNAMLIEEQYINHPLTIYCYEYTTGETWARRLMESSDEIEHTIILLDGKTPPDYVTLSFPPSKAVNIGAPLDMRTLLNISPYPVEEPALNWTSSAPGVASVDDNGVLTPIAKGSAVITATAREYPTLTASIHITVKKGIEGFEIPGVFRMPVRTTETIPVRSIVPEDAAPSITWATENPLVATISQGGIVTAHSLGETLVTAASDSGVVRTCMLVVIRPAEIPKALLPSGTREIKPSAFENSGVLMAEIPNGCVSIGDAAFRNCAGLIAVRIPASVTVFGEDVFAGCPNAVIYCPEGSPAERYAADNGIDFINAFVD